MARSITDNQILDAALEVMLERGYGGTTTREIAIAAGVNEVTLFRRFGSKEKLLKAVVEQEAKSFDAAHIAHTGDVAADLLRIVAFYRDLVRTRGRMIALMISEMPRQPELLEIMQTPVRIFAEMTALIARYQDEGVLASEPPAHALTALIGPIMLSGLMAAVQPDVGAADFDAAAHVQLYLDGRTAPRPGVSS